MILQYKSTSVHCVFLPRFLYQFVWRNIYVVQMFNIYLKPLDKVIHHFRAWYHQYTDNTQLYISTPDCINEFFDVLTQCLEAIQVWAGRTDLSSVLTSMQLFSPLDQKHFLFALVGAPLPHSRLLCNLEVLLCSHLLLSKQMAPVPGKVLHGFILYST